MDRGAWWAIVPGVMRATTPPPLTPPILLPTLLSLQKSWDLVFSFLLSGTSEGPYDGLLLKDWWWFSH